jgi:hypothetical protein
MLDEPKMGGAVGVMVWTGPTGVWTEVLRYFGTGATKMM